VIAVRPVEGLPEIEAGVPLGAMLATAAEPKAEEVLVVSQKVVSKAEGRVRDLRDVTPGERARELARELGKDPRLVELILGESRSVVRAERGVLIVETASGLICANAGIDSSNVPGEERVALLPEDPDRSARALRAEIAATIGSAPAVVVADSFGRPWRIGQTDVAIGCAGLLALDDWRGRRDAQGRKLGATVIAVADEAAAAADLVRDKAAGAPAAVIAGLGRHVTRADGPGAAALRRAEADDLFR
jgi:coenzyme F420-0:L-glutamate ligase / coenzyme F420-1:gamma-L-glutamate ligase